MFERNQNLSSECRLLSLPSDLIGCILKMLGLHGANLRAACRHLSRHPLPDGVALALKVLKVGPSIPLWRHAPRRTARAVARCRWDYFTYRASLVWRTEWALALKDIDAAPINALLTAYEAFPPDESHLVRDGWIGANGTQRWLMENDKGAWKMHTSLYPAHAKLAILKAVEARMWDIIWGVDLQRQMSKHEIVAVVKRILTRMPMDNNHCFFFTIQGWIKYTPFLLAAETHNFPLVKYLAQRPDTDLRATSKGGNNAFAICKNAMRRNGKSEREIAASPVLHYLRSSCWCGEQPYRREGR